MIPKNNYTIQPPLFKSVLHSISQCIRLSAEEKNIFCGLLNEKHYSKKDDVLRIGELCREQNYVVNGCLKVFYLDERGGEHIAKFAIENWWAFDIESFFESVPAFYGIQCLEDTTVFQLSRENYEYLVSEIPSFEKFYRMLLQNSFIALQHRMIQNLSLSGEEKYRRFKLKYPGLEARISQRNVAAYLGITPVFLSMIRKESI